MKLRTKIIIGFLCVLCLTQIPFCINRLRTGRLAAKIAELNTNTNQSTLSGYKDLKGVVHIHSFLGGHSTGTFEELLDAAEDNKLDFVVMTEHASNDFDTSAMTLGDFYRNVLFIAGNEAETNDGNRFLVLSGFPELNAARKLGTQGFLDEIHSRNALAFVTYPEKFKAWDSDFDGTEIFSLNTNAKNMNPVSFVLDMIWSFRAYPEITIARHFSRPDSNLAQFDKLTSKRKLTLFAGTDAHSNLGFHIGDDANNRLFDLKFDRYETIFRLVRTHVLMPKDDEVNKENLLKCLKMGNSYVGFDVLSDSTGFTFTASNENESKILGEEIGLGDGEVTLKATAPQAARFIILRNGKQIYESGQATGVSIPIREQGTYRTEVYLDTLGSPFERMPWIISNPIYVR